METKRTFGNDARLELTYSGYPMFDLEKEFGRLLLPWGLEFFGSGYDMVNSERTLVYGPLDEDDGAVER